MRGQTRVKFIDSRMGIDLHCAGHARHARHATAGCRPGSVAVPHGAKAFQNAGRLHQSELAWPRVTVSHNTDACTLDVWTATEQCKLSEECICNSRRLH